MSEEVVTLVGCWMCGADPVRFDPNGNPLCANCDHEDTRILSVLIGAVLFPLLGYQQVIAMVFIIGMSWFLVHIMFSDTEVR